MATNDSHYLEKDDARAHEILLCIQTGKTVSDENRLRFQTQEFYLKTRQEMLAQLGDFEDALDRTWEIAQRCQLKLEKVREPFPKFDVPSEHTTDSYFEYRSPPGIREAPHPACGHARRRTAKARFGRIHGERLDLEIRIIQQMKYSGYFLIVWDFIRFAKAQGIPVGPGRGSAAGSLVSYSMGITDLDPLQYGLLFERFLNPERISMPDIDIDFCTHRRGEVIQYVTEKYGREQVAQIITFGTLGARAAIKDVGRALDMNFGEVDRLTKMIPNQLNIKLPQAIKKEPALSEAAAKDQRVAEVLGIAQRVEGMARNASVHAAGVVISPVPLRDLVPLYRTSRDEIVTQYDMVGLEDLSLLKMDFLGLTTLTIIHDCLALIEKHRGTRLSLDELPLDDAKTYQIFSKGFTSGVFQFESSGMRDILRRYEPSRIEDLCALNALYRPGPIQGGMIDDFISRKHGRKKVVYELPELKEVLEETYGVIVYQEQVMQISNLLAGYSLGEADLLRRAMGKKKASVMASQRELFIKGAIERKYPRAKVEKIFDLMAQFAGYGFNKSHSAAYAHLAYVTAYLKAHYPVEFMSALLTSESGNTDKVVHYINECREMGIRVLPPDVSASDFSFTPDGESIRFGLGAVKNLGHAPVDAIVEARRKVASFRSIFHFCESVDLSAANKRMIESLVKAGAMDSIPGSRAQIFASIGGAIEHGQRVWRDRYSGQTGLFAGTPEMEETEQPLPEVPDWTAAEVLAGEKEMLGFYVTGHPLDSYRDKIAELATHNSASLEGLERGAEVALCGVITSIQRKRNKEGKPWAAVQLEDWKGWVNAMLFSNSYEEVDSELVADRPVFVRGMALPEDGAPSKVSIKSIVPLEVARVDMPRLISIRVFIGKASQGDDDRAEELTKLFQGKPGESEVRLRLEKPRDFSVILDVEQRVRPDKEFRAEVERICGPESLEVLAD